MRQKILYILLMITTALSWSLKAEGQIKTITINGTKLNNIGSDKYFTYTDSEFGTIKFGNGTSNISYVDASTDYWVLGNKEATFNLTFDGGILINKNYIVQVKKVLVRMHSYGVGTKESTLRSTSTNNSSTVNIRTAGTNRGNDSYYTNIEILGDNLGSSYTVTVGSITGGFWLNKIEITYEAKPKFYFSATATPNNENYGSSTTSVTRYVLGSGGQTSATETATFTATPKDGYAFVGWGTTADATTYESTENPYQASITNSTPGSTANKTLYAIFKPVFNFTATAEKIYGHGTVTASVADKVLGEPSATSQDAEATFEATPNTDCTFEGWYYDREHIQLASNDATYKPTITNDAIGSTKNLTLYAWFKANQTLTWTNSYEKNIVRGTTIVGAAAATSSSRLDVTYTSSNSAIASVNASGDVTGEALSNDDVTITATQAGNDEYNPASITRDFHVIGKKEVTFTPTGFIGVNPTIHVDDVPTITIANEGDGFTYSSSDEDVLSISKDGNTITLTARKEGSSTITLNQPETTTHSAVSATYNITVAKVDNTLEIALSAQSALVDGTINVAINNQNNTGTAIVGTISDELLSSDIHQGDAVITYSDGVITAKNAGTAKITFTQEATDKYKGYTSATYDVTVNKINNTISLSLAGGSATNIKLKYGATATLSYSSEHTDEPISVARTSGFYTTYSNGTITAGNSAGTDIYEITQPETYKYESGYASFSVRVNNTDERTGYVLNDATQYKHGTGSGVMHQYTLSGPGERIYYKASRDGTAIYYNMYVECSADGNSWEEVQNNTSLSGNWKDFSCDIPETARYVRFRFPAGGTLTKYIKDVYVYRKTYVRASADKTDMGTVYTGSTNSATFTVDYSTTNGGSIHVNSSNSHFAVSATELATTDDSDGRKTFTVSYTPDPGQLGEESAVITVGDLFYSEQITLTATAAKQDNTFTVISDQNIKVDDVVADVYSNKNSTAPLNYSLSREGVITYDPETNKITAVGAGDATLTLSQNENDYYLPVTKTVKVTVTKYDQTISWDNELSGEERTLNIGDHLTNNTATSTSGLTVTYSSSNTNVIEVDPTTGEIVAKAGGSNIGITATQAGNYKYNEASITRYFTVISKIDATVITSLSETEENVLAIGSAVVTIECSAMLSESALTVIGNEDGIISYTFANNTFTITPQKAGGPVTITLTRNEDEGYNAIDKSYTIIVTNPELVLDPTADPVIEYSEYSKVTLNRTLKAGYNSIALPFNYTLSDLNADWAAQLSVVTYNVKDGYSLYFSKITEGTLNANEPYIIHVTTEKENPVFADVTVGTATAMEKQATGGVNQGGHAYTDWQMHSNYTPDFDMEGKYGVVNADGCLKQGGQGATLNAFTAYLTYGSTPNAAKPRVKAAFVNGEETDGLLELLQGPGQAMAVEVYDLQGRRLSAPQRGINLIRQSNGRVKKVTH